MLPQPQGDSDWLEQGVDFGGFRGIGGDRDTIRAERTSSFQ
jgi:hypothetical protein